VSTRLCLREPISEIFEAAKYLDDAVSAHLNGRRDLADELIRSADIPAIRDWTESLWGKGGPFSRPLAVENSPPFLPVDKRSKPRMPNSAWKKEIIKRDGFHCRFCGIRVVRPEVRARIRSAYPDALRWTDDNSNAGQHTAFQAMWLVFDHLLPHSRGGTSEPDNMVIACQPCNCGRAQLTLAEVGLADPRTREPVRSNWDGLERFR